MNFIPTSQETPRQTRRVRLPKLTAICGSTPWVGDEVTIRLPAELL